MNRGHESPEGTSKANTHSGSGTLFTGALTENPFILPIFENLFLYRVLIILQLWLPAYNRFPHTNIPI